MEPQKSEVEVGILYSLQRKEKFVVPKPFLSFCFGFVDTPICAETITGSMLGDHSQRYSGESHRARD